MACLGTSLFTARGIAVTAFRAPTDQQQRTGRRITPVHSLMCQGPQALAHQLQLMAASQHHSRSYGGGAHAS